MDKEFLEFLEAYQSMRNSQKIYFNTRLPQAMYEAKQKEKDLDKKAADLKEKLKNL
jgi:hypothetical protein